MGPNIDAFRLKGERSDSHSKVMENVFMHKIETILDNEDIPSRSRSHYLKFISILFDCTLTPQQQNM